MFGVVDTPNNPKKAKIQITIKLKNIQSRLIQCHVDEIRASIQGKTAPDNYLNKGGYIYSGQEISFVLPFIADTDILLEVTGEVEYRISYSVVGSTVKHTTAKKLKLMSYPGRKTDYAIVTESES